MLLTWTVECVDRCCVGSVWVRRWYDCGSEDMTHTGEDATVHVSVGEMVSQVVA